MPQYLQYSREIKSKVVLEVAQSGLGAHPVSCNSGYRVSFTGVRWHGRGRVVDHPPLSSAEVRV